MRIAGLQAFTLIEDGPTEVNECNGDFSTLGLGETNGPRPANGDITPFELLVARRSFSSKLTMMCRGAWRQRRC